MVRHALQCQQNPGYPKLEEFVFGFTDVVYMQYLNSQGFYSRLRIIVKCGLSTQVRCMSKEKERTWVSITLRNIRF